jgi:hypothetical protein
MLMTNSQHAAPPHAPEPGFGNSLSDPVRRLFSEAIGALIGGETPRERLFRAKHYIDALENIPDEVPTELFDELIALAWWFSANSDNLELSSSFEEELTERAFALYIDITGGALIF